MYDLPKAAYRLVVGFVSASFTGKAKPWMPFLVFLVPYVLLNLLGPRKLFYIPPLLGTALFVLWLAFGTWLVLSIWRCAKNATSYWVAVWKIVAIACAVPNIAVPVLVLGTQVLMHVG